MPRVLIASFLTGIANSLVGWAVIFACLFAGMDGLSANAAGFAVGLVVSFTLNRRYVFGVKGAISGKEIARYLAAFALAYAVNVAVLAIAQSALGNANPLAQIPAIGAYWLVFFLLARHFVFNRRSSD